MISRSHDIEFYRVQVEPFVDTRGELLFREAVPSSSVGAARAARWRHADCRATWEAPLVLRSSAIALTLGTEGALMDADFTRPETEPHDPLALALPVGARTPAGPLLVANRARAPQWRDHDVDGGRTTTVGCNAALPNCHGNAGSAATGVTMSANGGAAQALANTPTFTITPNVMATFVVNLVNPNLTAALVRGAGFVVFQTTRRRPMPMGCSGQGPSRTPATT